MEGIYMAIYTTKKSHDIPLPYYENLKQTKNCILTSRKMRMIYIQKKAPSSITLYVE